MNKKIQEKRAVAWNEMNSLYRVAASFFPKSRVSSSHSNMQDEEKTEFIVTINFEHGEEQDFTHRMDLNLIVDRMRWKLEQDTTPYLSIVRVI